MRLWLLLAGLWLLPTTWTRRSRALRIRLWLRSRPIGWRRSRRLALLRRRRLLLVCRRVMRRLRLVLRPGLRLVRLAVRLRRRLLLRLRRGLLRLRLVRRRMLLAL